MFNKSVKFVGSVAALAIKGFVIGIIVVGCAEAIMENSMKHYNKFMNDLLKS